MKRSDIAEIVAGLGGIVHRYVALDTDYLIEGSKGNPNWKYGIYGEKIDRAMRLRATGSAVIVVPEEAFWKAVGM